MLAARLARVVPAISACEGEGRGEGRLRWKSESLRENSKAGVPRLSGR